MFKYQVYTIYFAEIELKFLKLIMDSEWVSRVYIS